MTLPRAVCFERCHASWFDFLSMYRLIKHQTSLPENLCLLPYITLCFLSFRLPLFFNPCADFFYTKSSYTDSRSRCAANYLLTILSFYLLSLCKKPFLVLSSPSWTVKKKHCVIPVLLKLVSQCSTNKLGCLWPFAFLELSSVCKHYIGYYGNSDNTMICLLK